MNFKRPEFEFVTRWLNIKAYEGVAASSKRRSREIFHKINVVSPTGLGDSRIWRYFDQVINGSINQGIGL